MFVTKTKIELELRLWHMEAQTTRLLCNLWENVGLKNNLADKILDFQQTQFGENNFTSKKNYSSPMYNLLLNKTPLFLEVHLG